MSDDMRAVGARKGNDDLWILDFARRTTPQLRDLMTSEEGKLPASLSDRLERLRRSEEDAS
jgi:hypothetical protein